MAVETIPAVLRDAYADWRWSPVWEYADRVTAWRLERDDAILYAKVGDSDAPYPVRGEAERMRWARAFIRVPAVVDAGGADGLDWLVTEPLPGDTAVRRDWCAEPEWIVPIVATGLRRWHETLPVDGCPYRLTIDDAIAQCGDNVARGRVDEAWLHDEFKHLGVSGGLEELARRAPKTEDLVVCHGDYCFPNVFIEDGVVTGYLDLGELNVADRWWDVAIGMWSTTWNVGPGYEELFARTYGVDVDDERLYFYRLLYGLIS